MGEPRCMGGIQASSPATSELDDVGTAHANGATPSYLGRRGTRYERRALPSPELQGGQGRHPDGASRRTGQAIPRMPTVLRVVEGQDLSTKTRRHGDSETRSFLGLGRCLT